ncbi:MAG: LysR family transcriptional regulator [Bilifractor sp.]
MIEMKELKTFVVCADVASFSKAAEILYTTQPNVSKMIRTLEGKLGFPVFYRERRGIKLTDKGRVVYEHAEAIIREEEHLTHDLQSGNREEFCIAMNSGSWIADTLTEYYQAFREPNVRYCFLEGSIRTVCGYVSSGRAEAGFIRYRPEQENGITYRLRKNALTFEKLRDAETFLYYGKKYHNTGNGGNEDLPELVQNYEDEFTMDYGLDSFSYDRDDSLNGHVAVVTNSDYIMQRMLRKTALCNVSTGDFSSQSDFVRKRLEGKTAVFGMLTRSGEALSDRTVKLKKFLEEKMQTSQLHEENQIPQIR